MRQLRHGILATLLPSWWALGSAVHKRLYAVAAAWDLTVNASLEASIADQPGYGTPTALPYIGRDRLIPRGKAEPDEAYIERLIGWRPDHKQAGSPWVTMRQLIGYLYPHRFMIRLVNAEGTWYTMYPDGSTDRSVGANWDWDGDPELWSRFWLVLYPPPALWVPDGTWANADNSTWGDDPRATWGSTATLDEVADIRSIIESWRSAHGLCVHAIISFIPGDFDPTDGQPPNPDGQWAHFSKLDAGDNCVPARNRLALYWRGT